jgi:hypothetical protein
MALTLKQKLDSFKYFLTNPEALRMVFSFPESGYLHDVGWFRSLKEKKPVDKDGRPIPWFSYPAIEFIESKLSDNLKVFEFGSGNSTIFFSNRVSSVFAVEHDYNWYNELRKFESEKLKIFFTQSDSFENYIKPLIVSNSVYDIIVVDGLFRNECVKFSLKNLTEKGIIILDDSERIEYDDALNFLKENQFRRLDFWGIAPIVFHTKCTSIFYKDKNCLNI